MTVGVPLVEEIFYRHILIGKLSAYAPTWLVASISAALFAYMHSPPVAGTLLIPAAQHRPNTHLREVREERRLLMLFHALNNTIMVALMFTMQGALQNA